jgi:hypothetical protein
MNSFKGPGSYAQITAGKSQGYWLEIVASRRREGWLETEAQQQNRFGKHWTEGYRALQMGLYGGGLSAPTLWRIRVRTAMPLAARAETLGRAAVYYVPVQSLKHTGDAVAHPRTGLIG